MKNNSYSVFRRQFTIYTNCVDEHFAFREFVCILCDNSPQSEREYHQSRIEYILSSIPRRFQSSEGRRECSKLLAGRRFNSIYVTRRDRLRRRRHTIIVPAHCSSGVSTLGGSHSSLKSVSQSLCRASRSGIELCYILFQKFKLSTLNKKRGDHAYFRKASLYQNAIVDMCRDWFPIKRRLSRA